MLVLSGTVCGNVVIENGATADVTGTVVGTVVNDGGELAVAGMIGGVRSSPIARTDIRSGAVVGGTMVRQESRSE